MPSSVAVQTRWMNDGSAGLLCLCFPINFAKALGEHHFLTQAGICGSLFSWLPAEKRCLSWSTAGHTEELGMFCYWSLFFMW